MNIKASDQVVVITGNDADPKPRKVLRVVADKLLIEGVNRVRKHVKPDRRNAQGGIVSKEMPIHVSNVMIYCPNCKQGVRIGRRYHEDGHKERFCRKCNKGLGSLSKPRSTKTRNKAVESQEKQGLAR